MQHSLNLCQKTCHRRVNRRRAWRNVMLAVLMLAVTSCAAQGCGTVDEAPRMEYYIQGGSLDFKQPSTVRQPVEDYVRLMMTGRNFFMDLYRIDDPCAEERYKLHGDWISSRTSFEYHGYSLIGYDPICLSGQLRTSGSTLTFDLTFISVPDERFTNLTAWGTCDIHAAQRLITQVRWPAWCDNTSSASVEVSWQLCGEYNGRPFELEFTQVYYGKSRYPMYTQPHGHHHY